MRILRSLAPLALLPVLGVGSPAAGAEDGGGSNQFSDGSVAPSYRVITYRGKDGVPVFTDQVPIGQKYTVMAFSCFACNPASTVDWNAIPLHTAAYSTAIASTAREHGVDPALVRAVIHAESNFNPRALSPKGAIGLMQLMPGTARDMGVRDATVATDNIEGGVKYLAMLLEQYDGDLTLATAAYNAGPATVARYGGVPPIAETQTYVKRVKILHERYRKEARG